MDYLKRFFAVLGVSILIGMGCGLLMTAILGPGLFPDRSYLDGLRVGLKGGLIFGGMWGMGLAIVACFMLGHAKGVGARPAGWEADREEGTR